MDGDRIRAARERRGLTQEELAAMLGVGYKTVGNWERNVTDPKNRLGMLLDLFPELDTPSETDPLRESSEIALLAELFRRATERQRGAVV